MRYPSLGWLAASNFCYSCLRLLRDSYSSLKRWREGFIKSMMLRKLAIFLASSSSSFRSAVFGGTLVTLLSSCWAQVYKSNWSPAFVDVWSSCNSEGSLDAGVAASSALDPAAFCGRVASVLPSSAGVDLVFGGIVENWTGYPPKRIGKDSNVRWGYG